MSDPSDLASRLILNDPEIKLLHAKREDYPPLALALQEHFERLKDCRKLVLPDLAAFGNDSVAIFSDYGGESCGRFKTYSALLCGFGYTGLFQKKMRSVREKHGLREKEIAFKDFGMGALRRALPDYLDALDNLPGLLCTLAIDKRIPTVFGPQEKSTRNRLAKILEDEGLGKWKPDVAEKLFRVVHLVAFLTALLARDGQKVFWMSDNDAICPHAKGHGYSLALFDRVLEVYKPNLTFPIVGGALPFEPRCTEMLDLLSIADLVAGSIEPCIPLEGLMPDGNSRIKAGGDDVLRWLTHDGIGLKKSTLFIRRGPTVGTIENGSLQFGPKMR